MRFSKILLKSFHILFICALIFPALLIGCSSGPESDTRKKDTALLPTASGKAGELILVADSARWNGLLGDQLREIFKSPVVGLPRDEALFSVRYVDPRKLNSVLKAVKNLVFVSVIDGASEGDMILKRYFTVDSRQKIKKDSSIYVTTTQSQFAKGQEVMFLFGQDEAALLKNLSKNKSSIRNHFNKVEKKRLARGLYKAKKVTGITKVMIEEHQCSIDVPFAYELAKNTKDFIWVRQLGQKIDKNFFVAHKPYTDQKDLSHDSLIVWRDRVIEKHLFEDPERPETFLVTEKRYRPIVKNITFNGQYAAKIKGLWTTNTTSMGGPFVAYALVDETLNRLYYIEGFVYSPGVLQRESMREMEVILSTFKRGNDIKANDIEK